MDSKELRSYARGVYPTLDTSRMRKRVPLARGVYLTQDTSSIGTHSYILDSK